MHNCERQFWAFSVSDTISLLSRDRIENPREWRLPVDLTKGNFWGDKLTLLELPIRYHSYSNTGNSDGDSVLVLLNAALGRKQAFCIFLKPPSFFLPSRPWPVCLLVELLTFLPPEEWTPTPVRDPSQWPLWLLMLRWGIIRRQQGLLPQVDLRVPSWMHIFSGVLSEVPPGAWRLFGVLIQRETPTHWHGPIIQVVYEFRRTVIFVESDHGRHSHHIW